MPVFRDYLTTQEAADFLGIHYQSMRRLIASGKFNFRVISVGHQNFIPMERLEDYRAQHKRRGKQ